MNEMYNQETCSRGNRMPSTADMACDLCAHPLYIQMLPNPRQQHHVCSQECMYCTRVCCQPHVKPARQAQWPACMCGTHPVTCPGPTCTHACMLQAC
jgi:hypothetical protein